MPIFNWHKKKKKEKKNVSSVLHWYMHLIHPYTCVYMSHIHMMYIDVL